MRYLRQCYPSIKISVEAEKPARPGLQELANEADVVFYSKSWAQVRLLPTTAHIVSQGHSLLNLVQGQAYASAEECLRKQSRMTCNA
jgi:ketohexokinase